MLRSSKHNISEYSNQGKLEYLDQLFYDYKNDLEIYIDKILSGELPLRINLSSKDIPSETIVHSKYKREIYKQASSIIRSQIDKANKRRYNNYKFIYSYMSFNHPDTTFTKKKYSDLKLNSIIKTKYFTKPNLNNISINLTNEFFDINQNIKKFDHFITLKTPYFNDKKTRSIKISLPFNHHRHSNKFKLNEFKLRNNIQLKKVKGIYYLNLIWEKEVKTLNVSNEKIVGIDTGYRKLIATSEGQLLGKDDMLALYGDIVTSKRNSKTYKRKLVLRDNLINYYANQIDLTNVGTIVMERLKNVKHKSKYNNKVNDLISRWTYRPLLNKIKMICEVNGIMFVDVPPAYTSQTCSSCGMLDRDGRQGDIFRCSHCSEEIDADYNASINIRDKGVHSLLTTKS